MKENINRPTSEWPFVFHKPRCRECCQSFRGLCRVLAWTESLELWTTWAACDHGSSRGDLFFMLEIGKKKNPLSQGFSELTVLAHCPQTSLNKMCGIQLWNSHFMFAHAPSTWKHSKNLKTLFEMPFPPIPYFLRMPQNIFRDIPICEIMCI